MQKPALGQRGGREFNIETIEANFIVKQISYFIKRFD
jgi:hypothetical protein